MQRSGGQIIVDALIANGVDRIFGVPGESYLPILDALVDAPGIDLTIARQEGGAAMMAEADAKLTGRPGVCLVTRGPGAANAYAGVHVAAQDSTPLVLLMGQVARDDIDREAFQEVDVRTMFAGQAKWAAQVNDTARLPEYMARAFSCAMSGRPGPVVLALPEDVLSASAPVAAPEPSVVSAGFPGATQMSAVAAELTRSRRPLMIVGGEYWSGEDCRRLLDFSAAWSLPVSCAFRCQDRFPNSHPNYAGDAGLGINPALAARIREADLIIGLGARLGDCTTSGFSLVDIPNPAQRFIHIHPDPNELGRIYQPELAINASAGHFLAMAHELEAPSQCEWQDWTRAANADYRSWTDEATTVPGEFNMGTAITWLRDALPRDAIITNGAGNYSTWVHRYYRHDAYRTQLAPTSGSMGYGLPAATAAKLRHPDREVVAFAGDGCFQMTGQELGTIAEHGLKIIVIVVNNAMYGTIRMHQEKSYPGRVSGTDIKNPDFATIAHAYGLRGETITRTEDFADAIERARAADTACLIEIRTDPRALTPTRRLPDRA